MKKNFSNDEGKFTYHLDRACRYCSAPIPDQDHSKREFCPVTYDNEGRVRDCKTNYYKEKNKPDRHLFAQFIAKQKAITTRIDFLVTKKGFEVSTEDLDVYDIKLRDALEYNIEKNGILTSKFFKYTITSNPISNIHKIAYND